METQRSEIWTWQFGFARCQFSISSDRYFLLLYSAYVDHCKEPYAFHQTSVAIQRLQETIEILATVDLTAYCMSEPPANWKG